MNGPSANGDPIHRDEQPPATVAEPPGPSSPPAGPGGAPRISPNGDPIHREPRGLRPPYDVPDEQFEHLRASNVDAWRLVVRLDRAAAMAEPLTGLDVGAYEHRVLEWLAGMDTPTVAVVAALLHRARAAAPLGAP